MKMFLLTSSGGVLMNIGLVLMMSLLATQSNGEDSLNFRKGFYDGKCTDKGSGLFEFLGPRPRPRPVDVEQVVLEIVSKKYKSDPTIVAALLRMQFHDCFVNGCDASILLDGNGSERKAPPNLSVRGYELIDDIKKALESKCPGVVSCADIIAMATRDAIFLATPPQSRFRPRLEVQTGRRDGTVSLATNVVDLPPPTATVSDSLKLFAKKNLDANDLVYLLGGGHSVGVTDCRFIQDRLFNFSNTGKPDSTMDRTFAANLRTYCAKDLTKKIKLDQGTPDFFDNSLYKQVAFFNKGIFRGDQELAFHPETKQTVEAIARASYQDFILNFGKSLQKLQAVGVLTGSRGEIRKTCSVRR